MSFEKNKVQVVKKKRLPKSDFSVECNIHVETEVGKIFSVCHTAEVENAEVLNGVVNYNGTIDFCVIFQSVDGEIQTSNFSCPFTSKFEDSQISTGDKVEIDVEVLDFSVDSVTSSNIKITCHVQQKCTIIFCRDVEIIDSSDENICTKKEEIYVSTREELHVLQYVVQKIINESGTEVSTGLPTVIKDNVSTRTISLAAMMLTSIPMFIAFPFLQKFFTKGLYVGSLKG